MGIPRTAAMQERLGTFDATKIAAMDPTKVECGVREATGAAPVPGEHGPPRLRPLSGHRRRVRRRPDPDLDGSEGCQGAPEAFRGASRLRRGKGAGHGRRRWEAPRRASHGLGDSRTGLADARRRQHRRRARGIPDPEARLQAAMRAEAAAKASAKPKATSGAKRRLAKPVSRGRR